MSSIKNNGIYMRISIEQVKQEYATLTPNGHWFDKETCQFFRSRLSQRSWCKGDFAYFISSEEGCSLARMYTIRVFDRRFGGIKTVGEFQQYITSSEAKAALKKIIGFI